jgi:hypothetical protein
MGEREWTVVVLPDTQVYTYLKPELFEAQGRLIVENRERLDIRFVLHEGDVVDDNGSDDQWAVVARALGPLEGVVPTAIAVGNHDLGPRGCSSTRETRLNDVLPWLSRGPTVLDTFEPGHAENIAHRFETPDGPWLVLALEFGPRDEVVAWASDLAARHADVPAILVNHAFMYSDGTRYDRATRPDQKWSPMLYGVGANDGETLFRKLVLPRSNIRLVLSGHVLNEGAARRTDVRPDGTAVHQMLANYQHRRDGGYSFLRLLTFSGRTLRVRTYAPAPSSSDQIRSNRPRSTRRCGWWPVPLRSSTTPGFPAASPR